VGAYPFSYDLSDLGHYYAAWHRLMRHWRETLGERLLIVQYEDLVTNQEIITHRILAHCGLEWEGQCLDFHRLQRPVTTASSVQVRQPIYTSSVGKWRHYERELAPLADLLATLEPAEGWRFISNGST
jgi:hypothetical protein